MTWYIVRRELYVVYSRMTYVYIISISLNVYDRFWYRLLNFISESEHVYEYFTLILFGLALGRQFFIFKMISIWQYKL